MRTIKKTEIIDLLQATLAAKEDFRARKLGTKESTPAETREAFDRFEVLILTLPYDQILEIVVGDGLAGIS